MSSWSPRLDAAGHVGSQRRDTLLLAKRHVILLLHSRQHRHSALRLFCLVATPIWSLLCALPDVSAGLFQHFDASAPDSFIDVGGTNVWLDQSGNGLHAVDDSAGSGSVDLSFDATAFPTGFSSLRFEGSNSANYGRLRLLTASASATLLNQSGPSAEGFSVFVVARSDTGAPATTWNDLIGNTTDVNDGAFLMRFANDNGRFQGALGGLTVQNNLPGQNNYGGGQASVFAFQYDPSNPVGEILLASSLNDYIQIFDLPSSVTDRNFANSDPLTLGKAFDTISRLFVGNIGEVKIYDAALPTIDFQNEIDDLATKWTTGPDGRLDLVIDRSSGSMTLHSPGSVPVSLAGMSFKSESGALDPSDWLSITENYDADSSSPSVDPDDDWLLFRSDSAELAEATLGEAILAPGQSIDLGAAFVLGAATDVVAEFADPIALDTNQIIVRYVNTSPADLLPGDFNEDGVVDIADYTTWRDGLGQEISLPNEVTSIGRVTQEDYDVWLDNFGAQAGSSTAFAVPEPAAGVIGTMVLSIGLALSGWRSRQSFASIAVVASFVIAGGMISTGHAQDITVGAYYYPWWDTHDWNETLRARMLPEDHRPSAGYSPSSDSGVIAEHINQSHRGNISLWASSWWGPGSVEDTVLQAAILPHPRAGELKHAVHYESTGRFGSFGSPDFSVMTSDFLYLAENVLSDPNYYRIDDRPVIFMYVTRAYFDNPAAAPALAAARQAVQNAYGYDPYVVGDEIFGSSFNATRAGHFDAVTTFDVYAMSGMSSGTVSFSDVQTADNKYAAAAAAGATVIPGITPGYNDTAVRSGNQPTGRYYSGQTIADAGEVFTDLINQAALPNLDADADNLVLVNSFNEWHEDTQVEASVIAPASSVDDSPSGTDFTQGVTYEGYGTKYLDLLRAHTTPGLPTLIDGDADFDGDLDTADLTAFAQAWGSENLVGGVRTGGYNSRATLPDFNYDGVVDFADWFVMRRTHPAAAGVSLAALLRVPEPSSVVIVCLAVLSACLPVRARRGGSLSPAL